MDRVRVGIVNYLNSRPLAWSFLRGGHPDWLVPSFHRPSVVADLLAAGELDIGLVPSIELQRIPDLRVVPGLCVAATREVRSVLLVARKPLGRVRRVALDESSRTSVVLTRLLLEDRFGLTPEFVTAPASPDDMLENADAALVIGDPALRVDRDAMEVYDLAAQWRDWTGLPFVFAVWAISGHCERPGLIEIFEESLAAGLDEIDLIANEAAEEMGLSQANLKVYLTRHLRFHLGSEELAGLKEFFRRAEARELLTEAREIEFLSD